MPRTLLIEVVGNASQFAAELDRAAGKTRQMGKVAGVAGLALAGGLAFGLERSVKAAMEGQVSQKQLDQALQNTHQSLKAMEPALLSAESASRKLGFTDDDTRASLAKLETATGDTGKSIKDLALAEDIARLKHVDLDAATKMLTGTMAGNTRSAKALGLVLVPVTSHMDALKEKYKQLGQEIPKAEQIQAKILDKMATGASAIQAVTDKVHGQAKAYADTAAGGMAQFHAQMQHLEETLGQGLLPALTVVASALASAFGFLAAHTTTTKVLVGAVAALAATLIGVSVASSLVAAASGVAAAATGVWAAAQWLLNLALAADPIVLVVIAIAALVGGLVLAYQRSATFRAIVTATFDAVKGAATSVLNFFRANWPIIAVLISGPFAPLVALATNAFGVRSALVGAFDAVKNAVTGTLDAIVSTVERTFSRIVATIRNYIDNAVGAAGAVGRGILSGIQSGIAGIVSAVEEKANAIMAVIRSIPGRIVNALGDLSHLLYNAGSSIIQGLIDGLQSKLGEVEHLASSIAGKIAHLKGPLEYDRKLLVPHGQAIIEGLQTGMEAAMGGLLGSVGTIAPRVGAATAGGTLTSGGGMTVNVTVNGWVGNDQDLVEKLRRGLVQIQQRNGTLGFT